MLVWASKPISQLGINGGQGFRAKPGVAWCLSNMWMWSWQPLALASGLGTASQPGRKELPCVEPQSSPFLPPLPGSWASRACGLENAFPRKMAVAYGSSLLQETWSRRVSVHV